MKAWVDPDRCAGHGICTTICPSVFALTDDGYSEAIEGTIAAEFDEAVREAARQCPEHAIDVTDED
ncbi:MAG TPA: ferredoxin [Jiangellaceae bacterium]|uniref:Ferredoxin n=1 Tax=Mycolicibacillus parakoreensis TaxID=1069221 RepID=A0ABY3TYM0_9MYCO|nr:ferredoxin [Mycolicibacillus parakoreensis]MCV7317115.1 ferredoxin [Mycolicibacillus parakoreensis]ULN51435.1 ferredoxin [Mycolicibacillus parakoreensis]HLR93287.1 ferredoxin [Jiangellaceae bacterium]